MRICSALSMILIVSLLEGCAQGASQQTLGQNSGYQKRFQPLPGDGPDVVAELAAAKADSISGQAAMRAHNPAAAFAFMQKSQAELQDVNRKRTDAQAPVVMQQLRAIADGSTPASQTGTTRAAAAELLGGYYENGMGVRQDYAAARVWYEKAISFHENGIETTRAKAELAHLLGAGLGGHQDIARSEELIHSIGGRTQADKIAEEKRIQDQAATIWSLATSGSGQRSSGETGPSAIGCHYAMGSAPSIAGMMGCPPWSP